MPPRSSGRTVCPGANALEPGEAFARVSSVSTETEQQWICESCGWIYDPEEGDPDSGIEPGTRFEDIPDDWWCPVCGATKGDFEPYEG